MTTETRVTEFEDGSSIVTTETTETVMLDENGDPIDLDAELTEVVADEVVEPVVDAAVQIAEIEAERDITIAAIHADTQQAAIEAEQEGSNEWQRNIESQLAETNRQLSEVTQVLASLIPPPSQQSEANPSPTPLADESAVPTQDSLEPEAAEEKAPEPPKRPKKSRWI